uniref:t-SNARE coiled-coil homology domain-containing protein n=1 Tax=Mola mola TaxID=94237 RepID=A0A3Q3XL63_MOLML
SSDRCAEVSPQEDTEQVRRAEPSGLLEQISGQAAEVERRHGAILSSPEPDQSEYTELPGLNDDTKRNADLVRDKLKCECDTTRRLSGHVLRLAAVRRTHLLSRSVQQVCHLTRCFADVMRKHQAAQSCFREKLKAQIQRQLEIVNKVTTDEELEELLHRDNLAVFISHVSAGSLSIGSDASSRALSEIQSRYQDIVRLESSVRELHEVFVDAAVLLEIQGEMLNNIERNVSGAAEYVQVSKAETHKAVTYKKNPYKVASLPSDRRAEIILIITLD